MTFRQFVLNNAKRKFRSYFVYFLSSTIAVMTFFTYLLFLFHPELVQGEIGIFTKTIMQIAAVLSLVFSFLFIFYSISSFLQTRLKEFGLVTLLGMTSRQWNYMILLENMMIGSLATVIGILLGLLFSKFFLLIGSKALDIDPLPLYFPEQALWITFVTFICLFFILSLFTRLFVRQKKALEMLQGENKPKPDPKGSIALAVLSIVCLGVAIGLMNQELSQKNLWLSLALNMVGTYFFFTQLSLLLIRLLKKNKSFYWKGLRLLWITEMAYKLKDNARMFFMITIVAAMACTAAGTILVIHQKNAETYHTTHFAFQYFPQNTENDSKQLEYIETTLQQEGIAYQRLAIPSQWLTDTKEFEQVQIIGQSSYNQMAKALQLETLSLKNSEAFYIYAEVVGQNPSFELPDQVTVESGQILSIQGHLNKDLLSHEMLVVSDARYQQLQKQKTQIPEQSNILYHIPAWASDQLPSVDRKEYQVSEQLYAHNQNLLQQEKTGYLDARAVNYMSIKQSTNIMMFIGFFIASIFSIFSASFLYFRLFNNLQQDQRLYHSLSKVGMTWREMKKTATIQIAALFYIPFLVSVLQTWIGLQAVQGHFSFHNMTPAWMTIGLFFLIQTLYFFIIRARYVKKLKHMMV